MNQIALVLKLDIKKTRKREFLAQMEKVVPWDDLVALLAPNYPEGKNGRPPFSLHSMLRIHLPAAMVQPVRPGHGRGLL